MRDQVLQRVGSMLRHHCSGGLFGRCFGLSLNSGSGGLFSAFLAEAAARTRPASASRWPSASTGGLVGLGDDDAGNSGLAVELGDVPVGTSSLRTWSEG